MNDFNYLGIQINDTGLFKIHMETFYGKSINAMNSLASKINKYYTDSKISLLLVDEIVSSTVSVKNRDCQRKIFYKIHTS